MLRLLLIFLFCWQCMNRMFETSMKFSHIANNNGWAYLNKMSFAPGSAWFQTQMGIKGIPYGNGGQLTIQAIPEHQWQQQKQRKCQNLPKQSSLTYTLSFGNQQNKRIQKSFNIQDTTLYYFVLKDCKQNLKQQYKNDNLNLHIRLHLLNNGRQVGEEEDHWYIIPLIILSSAWLVYFYMTKMKGTDVKSQIHKIVMFVGVATQVSSLTWRTFGFLIYSYSGHDFGFFHFIYLFMHSISQSIVIGLIILIGFGWTINFMTIQHAGIYLPIGNFLFIQAGVMALVNAVLTLLSKFATNHHDRHHLFDDFNGTLVIIYRLIFVLIFLAGVIHTYAKSRIKVQKFIILFGIFGSLYITAVPVIIFISNNWISPKDRHQFVFVAVQTLKCITNIVLTLMLNLQHSQYSEISYQNRSFVPQQFKHF